MKFLIVWLKIRLRGPDDQLSHFVECAGPWQGFPSPTMAAKGCAIAVAAMLGQASHNGVFLIVRTFDQQMTPVGLRDDLVMAQQGAKLTLQFGSVMFGG